MVFLIGQDGSTLFSHQGVLFPRAVQYNAIEKRDRQLEPWFGLEMILIGFSYRKINIKIFHILNFKASAQKTSRINNTTIVSASNVTIDKSRNMWFRLFTPSNSNASYNSLPLVVYFHEGGFTSYAPDSLIFDTLCTRLAAEVPAVVASVNYRLAPEYRYPTQYEDSFDALKFIDEQNYDVLPASTDINKCFIAGDSAGGNIAHHVAFKACNYLSNFDKIKIIGLLTLQPFFGGEERVESEVRLNNAPVLNIAWTDWMWGCFLPEGADRNHHAVCVFGDGTNSHVNEELKKMDFPKSLVIVGGYDPLQDWQKKYVEWLQNCGKEVEMVEYDNAFHGVYEFPELAEYELLVNDVAKFIKKQAHCKLN